jgi:hypothetical protein
VRRSHARSPGRATVPEWHRGVLSGRHRSAQKPADLRFLASRLVGTRAIMIPHSFGSTDGGRPDLRISSF